MHAFMCACGGRGEGRIWVVDIEKLVKFYFEPVLSGILENFK